jgi:hypothetical protein
VIFTDLKLLNAQIAPSPTTSREQPLNSKTTFLVQYIYGEADLVGQIVAYVLAQYFRQPGVAALVSLRRASAGSILAM